MSELKVVAVGKDGGPVLVGKHVIELHDKTTSTYHTCIIADFLRYLIGKNPIVLYYNQDSITAMWDGVSREKANPIAVCSLKITEFMRRLVQANNGPMSIKAFRDMLFSLRMFYDKNGKDLYDRALNFSLSTVTAFEQSSDNQGNFHFRVTCEKQGAKDVNFPETVTFTVPMFELLADTMQVTFDVVLDHCINKEKVEISFCLKNPMLSVQVKEAQKAIIEQHLPPLSDTWKRFWGDLEVNKADDSWKYQDNGIKL